MYKYAGKHSGIYCEDCPIALVGVDGEVRKPMVKKLGFKSK